MDSHVAVDALAVSVPFLPVTVLAWVVSAEPAIRTLGLLPPIAALLQVFLKPRAKLEVTSFEEIKVEKDGNRGFRFKGSARSKGRPIISNVEVKLQFEPSMTGYYVHLTDTDGNRYVNERKTWGPVQESNAIAQTTKLRQDDSFQFEYPNDEIVEASIQDPKSRIVTSSYYNFYACLGTTPCRVRVLVQGDGPDGNTVSAKKDIHVTGARNPT
jgi:hypothetical protein